MFRKVSFLAVVLSLFVAANLQAAVINSSWVVTEGPWGNPDNWFPAIVPDNNATNTFNVTIDGSSSEVDVGLQQHRTINQLDCYGEVELRNYSQGWVTLTLDNGILTNHSNSTLEINQGVCIEGSVENYGELEIECDIEGNLTNKAGGYLDMWDHLNIYGNLINDPCAVIEVSYHDIDIEDANIVNNGLIAASEDGGLGEAIEFHNNAQIKLFSGHCHGGIFYNHAGAAIVGNGTITAEQSIVNDGVICAARGSLLIGCEGPIINTGIINSDAEASVYLANAPNDVNNQGQITVNANGSVTVKSETYMTMPEDCTLNNEPNAVIELLGGTLAAGTIVQKANANFTGFGGITGNIIIESGGVIRLTGPTNIVGNVTIQTGGTLEISDGQTLITGDTTNNGTIKLIGGTPVFQGEYNGNTVIYEQSTQRSSFDFIRDGAVNFEDFAEFAENWLWQASWFSE